MIYRAGLLGQPAGHPLREEAGIVLENLKDPFEVSCDRRGAYGAKTRSCWKHEILSGWLRRRYADVRRRSLCDV